LNPSVTPHKNQFTVKVILLQFFISNVFFSFSQINQSLSEPIIATKLTEEIIFDGISEEKSWEKSIKFPMVMLSPVAGGQPTEVHTFGLLYDEKYLYISCHLNYSDPAEIRNIGKKRDYNSPSTDWIGILLDTYNDKENAVTFWVNPNGLRYDASIKNDCEDLEEDVNESWNTFWNVKTIIGDSSWSAEIRIPFSSLRFQTTDELTTMGLILVTSLAKKVEVSSFPVLSPDYNVSFFKPSLAREIVFNGIRPKRMTYITPYAIAGLEEVNEHDEISGDFQKVRNPEYDLGLDAKYSISNNLTADITINTDFAQVEADDQQINLTRYSLVFPEKRPFFLEKADVFDFSLLGGNNLFYSRRIGLNQGKPVSIYGGARLTGKVNKWDIGFLDMQTAGYDGLPSENFAVLRTKRRNVFNKNSYIGGMTTSRIGMNGQYNLAYGIDGLFKVKDQKYITFKWSQSFEKDSLNKVFDLAPSRLLFEFKNRKITGFSYDFVYTWSGKSFNPGIGFEVKQNYHGVRVILNYGWLTEKSSLIRYHKIYFTGYDFLNTLTGLQETYIASLAWDFEAKDGSYWGLALNYYIEDLHALTHFGDGMIEIPEGRYPYFYLSANYSTSESRALTIGLSGEAGQFYDGVKYSIDMSPKWKVGSDLELSFDYQYDHISISNRELYFKNHIAGIKGLLTLTTQTSFSAFIQYNSAIDRIYSNFRFRYNPKEGNDLYIVYNDGYNTYIPSEDPQKPYLLSRMILLKYTYTLKV
jgi:hypothetical protein